MEIKASHKLPKGFFSQPRPTVSSKEALKDIIPIKWNKDVLDGNKKVVVHSAKTRKS